MSPDDASKGAFERARPERTAMELAVELTMAWLKRVENTADGRDPKEVVQALDDFFQAILSHKEREAHEGQRATAAAR